MSDFKWHTEDKEAVVVPSVQAVAVYRNESGDLVIRQQGYMGEDDSIIVVPTMFVQPLMDSIKTAMSE